METENKAVLISIKPKWCELIASDEKTIEVRKTKPKLKPPFKCYIYCTKSTQSDRLWTLCKNERKENFGLSAICANLNATSGICLGDGKVIGEFVCDTIVTDKTFGHDPLFNGAACMSEAEAAAYSCQSPMYGWHISDLKIYDKPRELSEFGAICRHYDDGRCGRCEYYDYANNESYSYEECAVDGLKPITKAPQSWCYVEELESGLAPATENFELFELMEV